MTANTAGVAECLRYSVVHEGWREALMWTVASLRPVSLAAGLPTKAMQQRSSLFGAFASNEY
jgi:hypothetical protein